MSFELSFDEMIKFLSLAGQGFKRGKREKIIKKYPGTFANYSKVNEVFGRFKNYFWR